MRDASVDEHGAPGMGDDACLRVRGGIVIECSGGWIVQRKDIDEVGFAILETELDGKQVLPGAIAAVTGRHPQHGHVVLVQAGGLYLALADDVSEIVGLDEPIEKDV